jgi:hypothetical protein
MSVLRCERSPWQSASKYISVHRLQKTSQRLIVWLGSMPRKCKKCICEKACICAGAPRPQEAAQNSQQQGPESGCDPCASAGPSGVESSHTRCSVPAAAAPKDDAGDLQQDPPDMPPVADAGGFDGGYEDVFEGGDDWGDVPQEDDAIGLGMLLLPFLKCFQTPFCNKLSDLKCNIELVVCFLMLCCSDSCAETEKLKAQYPY